MKALKSFLIFLLSSHVFVSLCAVALTLETSVVLNSTFQSIPFYTFIFFATLFTYNLYYVKTQTFIYAKSFSIIGLIGSSISLCHMSYVPWFYLGITSILSSMYLLPIFIPIVKQKSFTIQKLFILILVWVTLTLLTPLSQLNHTYSTTLTVLFRILLMTHLCVLFFIKDELNVRYKQTAINACIIISILQIANCILLALNHHVIIACIYFISTLLCILTGQKFNRKHPSNLHYLFFVDGIMLLQGIFVLLKFLFSL